MQLHIPASMSVALWALLAGLPLSAPRADSVKPDHSGPFLQNQINITGSPAGYRYVLPNAFYHFHLGWLEPFSQSKEGFFGNTYFETSGNLNVSPFTTDVGTSFNLKPFRYLEFGLTYSRMVYHNSMVTFDSGSYVSKDQFLPDSVLARFGDTPGGADIFTYQVNLTFDIGPVQLYAYASRAQWDVNAKGQDFAYEYGTDFLIKTKDRLNTIQGRINLDLSPYNGFKSISYLGLSLRNQYWWVDRMPFAKNLVSAGVNGIRLGRNTSRQTRGLDVFIGYWTEHHQVPEGDIENSFLIILDWKWNIQALKM